MDLKRMIDMVIRFYRTGHAVAAKFMMDGAYRQYGHRLVMLALNLQLGRVL